MGVATKCHFALLCIMALALVPALSYSQDNYVPSRATYYGTSDGMGTPTGACGYGKYGRTVYNGKVTAVSNNLYKNGVGCGACYQVRCKIPQLCTREGVKVVVTDHGEGDRTDFILSSKAYESMALPNAAPELFSYGVVGIEYRRVSCEYPMNKLAVKVLETSRFPDYLAIIFLYQAGKYDITAVEVSQPRKGQWSSMRRAYGAVWDISNPPKGDLTLRIEVSGLPGWIQLDRVIPCEWMAGATYPTIIKLPN